MVIFYVHKFNISCTSILSYMGSKLYTDTYPEWFVPALSSVERSLILAVGYYILIDRELQALEL